MVGLYDYQQGVLHQDPTDGFIGIKDLEGNEVETFPVIVINVNEEAIGEASTKEEYMRIWNADPDNAIVGRITGWYGPFHFNLKLNPGQVLPDTVLAELTIYLLDENGVQILDENSDFIYYK